MSIKIIDSIALSLVIALCLAASTVGYANPPVLDVAKAMVIDGPITGGSIAPLKQALLQELASGKVRPELQLIINSPGGSVFAGFQVISVLKAAKEKGMHLTCIVPSLAASMAFQILLQCDERHVLNESLLLWHRARVMGINKPMTGPELAHLGQELEETDNSIMDDLLATIDMSKEDIAYHFNHETLHLGKALCGTKTSKFCHSYNTIPNLFEVMNSPKVVHSAEENPFMKFFKSGEIIYISPLFIPVE